MGTATMQFKEGIYVTGSAHNPDGTDSNYSLVVSGTMYSDVNNPNIFAAILKNHDQGNGHVLKLTTEGTDKNSKLLSVEGATEGEFMLIRGDGRVGLGRVSALSNARLVVSGVNDNQSDIAISHKLQHLGDSDTHISFPANDQMSLTAGNVNLITLEEHASQPNNVFVNMGLQNTDFVVCGQTNQDLFYVDGSSDNIGIGTEPDEAYNLHISGSTTVSVLIGEGGSTNHNSTSTSKILLTADKGNSSVTGSILVQSPGGSFAHNMLMGTNSGHNVRLISNNAQRILLKSDGNVAIGSSDALFPLDITGETIIRNSSAQSDLGLYRHNASITTDMELGRLLIGGSENNTNFFPGVAIIGKATENWTPSSAEGTELNFWTTPNTSATLTQRMNIGNDGKVGVNKTSPTSKLHVGGTFTADDDIYALQDLNVSGALNLSSLALNTDFSPTAGNILAQKTGAQPGITLIHSASTLLGHTDHLEPQTTFGDLSFAGSNDTANNFAIGASISAITEGTWNITSDRPTALVFKTTESGTAINAEKMRLDNGGNLGLGTQDPAYNLHVEATGSGPRPRIGIVNRSNSIESGDQVGSLIFAAVRNTAFDSSHRTLAAIDTIAEQDFDVAGLDGSLNFETKINFRTAGSTGVTNAVAITGDNELQVDTITALDSDVQTEKIQWRHNTVNMAGGLPAASYDERIEISGSIKYAQFVKSNVQINGQEQTISAQPHRAHFNPNGVEDFEFRIGKINSVGTDQCVFISGSIDSKGTAEKGTTVFGGDVVVSGSLYDEDGNKYAKSNKVVAYGSISLQRNGGRTVSFDRQTSLGDGAGGYASVKSFLFAPFNGIVSKIVVNLKSAVDADSHGIITVSTFKNANGFSPASSAIALSADSFSQVNASNPTVHKCTFESGSPLSISEGDLLQFTVARNDAGTAGTTEGVVMIILEEDF